MPPASSWQPYLPVAIIAAVALLRMRKITKARRMRPGGLLIRPIIVGLLAASLFFSVAPDVAGVAIFAVAMAAGAALGWQRARWMTVTYEPATGTFMLKQSPLALVLLIGVMIGRRILLPGGSIPTSGSAHVGPQAMWVIDGLIGFGLGTVTGQNIELWRRARTVRAGGRFR